MHQNLSLLLTRPEVHPDVVTACGLGAHPGCNIPVTGADQSAIAYIDDHVEYHNDFAIGAYDFGDVSMRNLTSVDGVKSMYWKTYRRGKDHGPLVDGATFRATVQASGGQGMVEFRNVWWESSHLDLNHHCGLDVEATGGLCASTFVITNATGPYADDLRFRDETPGHKTSCTVEYNGTTLFQTQGHPVFANDTCSTTAEHFGTVWNSCPSEWGIRSVRIFSPDRGPLAVRDVVNGVNYTVPFRDITKEPSIGRYGAFSPRGRSRPIGYTFLVRDGQEIRVTIPNVLSDDPGGPGDDLFAVEYAEALLPTTSIVLEVTGDARFAGSATTITNAHDRSFLTPYGAIVADAGAWWHAHQYSVAYDRAAYREDVVSKASALMSISG